MNLKETLALVRKGELVADSETTELAKLIVSSEKYIQNYVETYGTKSFITERLRDGYIGKEVFTDTGTSYLQSKRGKPFGQIVAIPTDNGVAIGVSYMDEEDKNIGHSSIGLAIALKRAISAKEGSKSISVKSKAHEQAEHFEKRALAFFHPEVYSHSRGTNPVVYKNYDLIHQNRAKILGENK